MHGPQLRRARLRGSSAVMKYWACRCGGTGPCPGRDAARSFMPLRRTGTARDTGACTAPALQRTTPRRAARCAASGARRAHLVIPGRALRANPESRHGMLRAIPASAPAEERASLAGMTAPVNAFLTINRANFAEVKSSVVGRVRRGSTRGRQCGASLSKRWSFGRRADVWRPRTA